MKTIKFIGDPNDDHHGPETIRFYSMELTKGKAVKCADLRTLAKAEGSSHFIVETAKLGRPSKVKADAD